VIPWSSGIILAAAAAKEYCFEYKKFSPGTTGTTRCTKRSKDFIGQTANTAINVFMACDHSSQRMPFQLPVYYTHALYILNQVTCCCLHHNQYQPIKDAMTANIPLSMRSTSTTSLPNPRCERCYASMPKTGKRYQVLAKSSRHFSVEKNKSGNASKIRIGVQNHSF
jgi:hypothetical protein